MICKAIKAFFICVKHGINPFLPVAKNEKKMIEMLSDREKEWFISNARGYGKEYLKKIFAGD